MKIDKIKGEEIQFLGGPQSRWKEFVYLIDVFRDMFRGIRKLHFVGPCITIFGSARFKEDHPSYQDSIKMAQEMAKLGFTIMTGGGPGVMEAANRGARLLGAPSVGCNIVLPAEQFPNKYLDRWVNMNFFFTRKTLLIKYSYAFIVMPGGFGTMDEFFEAMTLIQTGKLSGFPVVLFGTKYFQHLITFIDNMVAEGAISPEDRSLYFLTDSIEEAVEYIKDSGVVQASLRPYNSIKRSKWLFEN